MRRVGLPLLLGAALGLSVVMISAFSVRANKLGESQSRLDSIKKELSERRADLADLDNQERSLTDAIGRLDEALSRLEKERKDTIHQKKELEETHKRLDVELKVQEKKYDVLQARTEQRLRALLVLGQGGTARILLGAQNFADLSLRRYILEKLTQNDLILFKERSATLKSVIENRKFVKASLEEIALIQTQLQEQDGLLREVRQERQVAVNRVSKEKDLVVRRARELQGQYQALTQLIAELVNPPKPKWAPGKRMFKKYHQLPWPTQGSLIQRFGKIVDRKTGVVVVSQGIHIRAKKGFPVRAVANGTAVHVGWLRGFGRLVIVDHGDSIHTLSAHLSDFNVMVGDRVREGQIVGYVGDTESLNGSKVYFELRRRGKPLNPMKWLGH